MRMPVLFVGHGSPMNTVEHNRFTGQWAEIAQAIPRPKAILCVSAHWYEAEQQVSVAPKPETIHDFYGFPPALFAVQYPAPGAPEMAREAAALLKGEGITLDANRGLDHGAWSVLHGMYPQADIPVCQLSVNAQNTPQQSYHIGTLLRPLRDAGVLILGSGNVVHNLSIIDWDMEGGYPWADTFDAYIRDAILSGDHEPVIEYARAGAPAKRAFVYRDHFDPLLYTLGASLPGDAVQVFCDERIMGAMSMTSYLIG